MSAWDAPLVSQKKLCAIEIFDPEYVEPFLGLNPALRQTTRGRAGRSTLFLFIPNGKCPKTKELFGKDGKAYGRFLDPDTVEYIYEITCLQTN
jgi:hypothetical protein